MVEIESIPIGPYRIGPDHSPLVIAEAAVNHQAPISSSFRFMSWITRCCETRRNRRTLPSRSM